MDSFLSARDLIQTVNENQIAQLTALNRLKESTFFEANSARGLDQLLIDHTIWCDLIP